MNYNLLAYIMKIVLNVLKWLGIVLLLLIVISFFLPSKVHVERSAMVNASPEAVFANIGNLKNWNAWSPWFKRDPEMKNTYEGADAAIGQKSIWTSKHPKVGNGSMEITELKPNELLVTKLDFDGNGGGYGTFKLEKMGDSTKVTWSMDSDGEDVPFLRKPMSKYLGLFMDGMLGPDFEEGLKGLKEVAESMPKEASKPQYEIQEINIEPQIVLTAPLEKVGVEGISGYLAKNFDELRGTALVSNLKPGVPSAIYHTWDGATTEMEAVLPVDKAPKGKIAFREIPATKALKIDYYGAYMGTESAHEAIYAFSQDKNIKLGSPWEAYVTDPSTEPDTAKWLTQVYYPILAE